MSEGPFISHNLPRHGYILDDCDFLFRQAVEVVYQTVDFAVGRVNLVLCAAEHAAPNRCQLKPNSPLAIATSTALSNSKLSPCKILPILALALFQRV